MKKFAHDGTLDWSCSECGKEGSFAFNSLETVSENPSQDDYIIVIARAEAEHATECRGALNFEGAFRNRYVETEESS